MYVHIYVYNNNNNISMRHADSTPWRGRAHRDRTYKIVENLPPPTPTIYTRI